jgi:hypothetical protein
MGPSYFDIHAGSGEAITKLVLSDGLPNLCCFEITVQQSAKTPTIPTRTRSAMKNWQGKLLRSS